MLSMPREQEALRKADLADELATGRLDSTICSSGRCIREARARSSPGLAGAPTALTVRRLGAGQRICGTG